MDKRGQLLALATLDSINHWIRGWVDRRASLEAVMKRRNLCPHEELQTYHTTWSLVNVLTELSQVFLVQV